MPMWNDIFSSQLFSLNLTLFTYFVARRLYLRRHWIIFNPLIFAPAVIILIMYLVGLDFDTYTTHTAMVKFFVGPATVALAIPLYKQIPVVKANLRIMAIGIITGATAGLTSVVLIVRYLGGSKITMASLAAKSTTMPIALGITDKLGGIPSIIIFGVVVAGTFGGMVGPEWLRLLGVKSKVATGLAIGSASHAGGTARAVQLGEVEGSMSGTAIVLCGLVTAFLAPWLVPWLMK